MNYTRVLPRDAFNEANLLKCIGQLALTLHENMNLSSIVYIDHENAQQGFNIAQDNNTGYIYCTNFYFYDSNGTPIYLHHPLNCKERYAMCFEYKGHTDFLFEDDGSISNAFLEILQEAR